MLEIVYQDEHFVAINKPAKILVHPTSISRDRTSCLKILRDQIGRYLYPVHRLDRATSGVLIFALDSDSARLLQGEFKERRVSKEYWAITRGWTDDTGFIDKPLREDKDREYLPSESHYRTLQRMELPFAVGPYATARYSLVAVNPLTGRQHQIRKHLHFISHPIVGDKLYGDLKHNSFFRSHVGLDRLWLTARTLEFTHPHTKLPLALEAPLPVDFQRILSDLPWNAASQLNPGRFN